MSDTGVPEQKEEIIPARDAGIGIPDADIVVVPAEVLPDQTNSPVEPIIIETAVPEPSIESPAALSSIGAVEVPMEKVSAPAKGGMMNMPTIPKKQVVSSSDEPAAASPAPVSIAQRAIISNYESDVANAMSQTDASQIQKFIQRAKDDEETAKERTTHNAQRTLLSTIAVICVLGAIAGIAYGTLHFKSLTVPLASNVSLGAFPTFASRIPLTVPLATVLDTISKDTTFTTGKPMLVDVVDASGTLVSPKELFAYLDIKATEPLQTSFVVTRYGFVKLSDTEVVPFIIGATADERIATKEFLIAEPSMTTLFANALMLDPSKIATVAGGGFAQEIVANIPLRILRAQKDDQRTTTLAYGFPTENVVVFSTDTRVFALVENTIIGQH